MIDYRYPEEKAALHELVRKKEFQAALKLFEKIYADATDFARLQGRNFRVTKAAQPRLHYLWSFPTSLPRRFTARTANARWF